LIFCGCKNILDGRAFAGTRKPKGSVFERPRQMGDGEVSIPHAIGLGVEMDEEMLEKWA
jgi:L-alanine-DL-glutamate epimerase-like enolase superfamily enzyme